MSFSKETASSLCLVKQVLHKYDDAEDPYEVQLFVIHCTRLPALDDDKEEGGGFVADSTEVIVALDVGEGSSLLETESTVVSAPVCSDDAWPWRNIGTVDSPSVVIVVDSTSRGFFLSVAFPPMAPLLLALRLSSSNLSLTFCK